MGPRKSRFEGDTEASSGHSGSEGPGIPSGKASRRPQDPWIWGQRGGIISDWAEAIGMEGGERKQEGPKIETQDL